MTEQTEWWFIALDARMTWTLDNPCLIGTDCWRLQHDGN